MKNNNQRVLIVDGPDRCGKTNIAKALSLRLKIPYFKLKNEEYKYWKENKFKESLEFDQVYSSQFLEQTKHSAIVDRAYPSEWVYSNVFNRDTNHDVLRDVDDRFSKLGAVILIPLRHDYSKCKDDLVDNSRLKEIHDKYIEFSNWSKCNIIKLYVDSYNDDLKKQAPKILKHLVFSRDKAIRYNIELGKSLNK